MATKKGSKMPTAPTPLTSDTLDPMEKSILYGMSRGMSNMEIARFLGLPVSSVAGYLNIILPIATQNDPAVTSVDDLGNWALRNRDLCWPPSP